MFLKYNIFCSPWNSLIRTVRGSYFTRSLFKFDLIMSGYKLFSLSHRTQESNWPHGNWTMTFLAKEYQNNSVFSGNYLWCFKFMQASITDTGRWKSFACLIQMINST